MTDSINLSRTQKWPKLSSKNRNSKKSQILGFQFLMSRIDTQPIYSLSLLGPLISMSAILPECRQCAFMLVKQCLLTYLSHLRKCSMSLKQVWISTKITLASHILSVSMIKCSCLSTILALWRILGALLTMKPTYIEERLVHLRKDYDSQSRTCMSLLICGLAIWLLWNGGMTYGSMSHLLLSCHFLQCNIPKSWNISTLHVGSLSISMLSGVSQQISCLALIQFANKFPQRKKQNTCLMASAMAKELHFWNNFLIYLDLKQWSKVCMHTSTLTNGVTRLCQILLVVCRPHGSIQVMRRSGLNSTSRNGAMSG